MHNRLLFQLLQLRKRLWAKPLIYCVMAVAGAFIANAADYYPHLGQAVPQIDKGTVEKLLDIISSSMLVVATFAAGSMISAYASASTSATPRAFALVMADDLSQTALSSFIGAFIYSIVASVALKVGLYGAAGLFVLFILTLAIFAWVIITFVRWTDNIARLGQIVTALDKTEAATSHAFAERRRNPFLGGVELTEATRLHGAELFSDEVGYVQYVDMKRLQRLAEAQDLRFQLAGLPGAFATPDNPILITAGHPLPPREVQEEIRNCFVIGKTRTFEEDPRFGLIVLAEIAARALSPGVNDPGTAIVVLGRMVRLFSEWAAPRDEDEVNRRQYDRIVVPSLSLASMFDDAFTAIGRDGAGAAEVGIRLQKALVSIARLNYPGMADEARRMSRRALEQARGALVLPGDVERLEEVAARLRQGT